MLSLSKHEVRTQNVQKPNATRRQPHFFPSRPPRAGSVAAPACASARCCAMPWREILNRNEIRDPDLDGVSVTITQVKPSPDMRYATVYCEPLGGKNAERDHRRAQPPQGIPARRDGPHDLHQIHARSALCRRQIFRRSREDREPSQIAAQVQRAICRLPTPATARRLSDRHDERVKRKGNRSMAG